MIAFLAGELLSVSESYAVINVGGVGYRVEIHPSAASLLPERGAEVRLHIHTCVREDAITLFGFMSAEAREVFELLLGVSGVGPKVAQAVYFIDKENIVLLQVGEKRRQISGVLNSRAGGNLDVDAHFLSYDMRQSGFAQAGRAVKKYMVERLLPSAGGLHAYIEVPLDMRLPDEVIQTPRSQRTVKFKILVTLSGCGYSFRHTHHLPKSWVIANRDISEPRE